MQHRRLATFGILLGLFLGAIDATVTGTAMPTAIPQLGGLPLYFLVFSGFMLASTVSMPLWGRLSDMYGRRRFHLVGIIIFVGASTLCGFSRSMTDLVVCRALQGIGAGALISLSFTMIGDLYPLEQRAKVQGAVSAMWGIAALLGPAIGAALTESLSWRWVFYVNIPFGLLSAAIVQATWKDEVPHGPQKPDVPGAVLLALASATLMGAFTVAARKGWLSTWALGGLGAAAALATVLVVVERRTVGPFLSYDLYKIRLFWTGAATGVCGVTCLFAATSYVPLFVQGVVGTSAYWAGMALMPMMVPWIVCSGSAGFLMSRFGYRALSIVGMSLCGVAFFLLFRLGVGSAWREVAAAMLFLGAGLGMTLAPLLIAAQNAVPRERLGAATSLMQFTRSMGAALGVAIMGSLMAHALQGDLSRPDAISNLRTGLTEEQIAALAGALARGLRRVFAFALGAAGAGVLFAFFIPRGRAQDLGAKVSASQKP